LSPNVLLAVAQSRLCLSYRQSISDEHPQDADEAFTGHALVPEIGLCIFEAHVKSYLSVGFFLLETNKPYDYHSRQ
jgi:hypothetical protein